MKNEALYRTIFREATQAAEHAHKTAICEPMVVIGGVREVVSDGPCGFAWVTIHPARGNFVKYLKENKIGKTAYQGGYQLWYSELCDSARSSQSYTRHYAAAVAFAHVLRKYDINAIPGGRLD